MTFLELFNRARRECGVAGGSLLSLENESALSLEGLRFKDWVNQAWIEVQLSNPSWNFMRREFEFDTVPGQFEYTPAQAGILDFGTWKRDSFRCFGGADFSNEQIMAFMEYDTYRNIYRYGSMRQNLSRPVVASIKPADKSLMLGATPDAVYTVVGDYFRTPQKMMADTDVPGMPEQFHMLIVYMAMISYAAFEYAPEVQTRGEKGMKMLITRLELDQMPIITNGPPLA